MKREFFRITSIGVLLTLFYSTAFAQQVSGGVEDDPVARSMKSVEAVVNPRAEAAGPGSDVMPSGPEPLRGSGTVQRPAVVRSFTNSLSV